MQSINLVAGIRKHQRDSFQEETETPARMALHKESKYQPRVGMRSDPFYIKHWSKFAESHQRQLVGTFRSFLPKAVSLSSGALARAAYW